MQLRGEDSEESLKLWNIDDFRWAIDAVKYGYYILRQRLQQNIWTYILKAQHHADFFFRLNAKSPFRAMWQANELNERELVEEEMALEWPLSSLPNKAIRVFPMGNHCMPMAFAFTSTVTSLTSPFLWTV